MRTFTALGIFSLASLCAGGCSSQTGAGPDTSTEEDLTPSAEQDLADLDVGPDELIADEAETEDDLVNGSRAAPEPDIADDDLESDLDEDLADDFPEELPDPPLDPATVDITTPGLEVLSTKPAPWWSKKYACPSNPLHAPCECRGSRYNCQFPNPQPGRNRYLPPAAMRAMKATKDHRRRVNILNYLGRWELADGQQLYDGAGQARGVVSGGCYNPDFSPNPNAGHACVKINFGQVKRMRVGGATSKYVYAFSTNAGSGWVQRDKILNPSFKAYDTPPRGTRSFAATKYVLKAAEDYGCQEASYDSTKCLPAWAQLKVDPNVPTTISVKARDYMLREGNVENLVYQTPLLGGAATDTFLVHQNTLDFRRAKSIDSDHRTILRIWLYHPNSSKRVGKMYFVFGAIAGRFGWVAAAALKKGSLARGASDDGSSGSGGTGNPDPGWWADTCDGKSDGVYCSGSIPDFAYRCIGGVPHGGLGCPSEPALCRQGPDGKAVVSADGVLQCDPQ